MVGVLRVSKSDFLSGLNNFKVYTWGNSTFGESFGFTRTEVESLLKLSVPQFLENNSVEEWYNGYKSATGTPMYNPWSIMNLCLDKVLGTYWVETGIALMFDFI